MLDRLVYPSSGLALILLVTAAGSILASRRDPTRHAHAGTVRRHDEPARPDTATPAGGHGVNKR